MKIAINGFGRIGRILARRLFENPQWSEKLELVAFNDLGTLEGAAFRLKYDTVHGRFNGTVSEDQSDLMINGKKITHCKTRNPEELPWKELGVDLVLECTGKFRDHEGASKHLAAGAKKVIISAPGKEDIDGTFVMGVNHQNYNPETDHIVSNASCTTNCLAPLMHVLHREFQVKQGLMTTVHSYTSDQRLLDNSHKDLRRGRTAALNLIPTTTGAAKSVGEVIPDLKGKLDGLAIRVPTANVSYTDIVAELEKPASKDEIHQKISTAAETDLNGILGFTDEPLVSSDFVGSSLSSVVDFGTTVISQPDASGRGNLVKMGSWYDNEAGFACRMLELALLIEKHYS